MRYMPQPVVTGFTAGIAVTIFTSQVKDLLGLPLQRLPGEFLAKWKLYLANLGDTNLSRVRAGPGLPRADRRAARWRRAGRHS
jgi:SulP family sulfate permease